MWWGEELRAQSRFVDEHGESHDPAEALAEWLDRRDEPAAIDDPASREAAIARMLSL